MRDESGQILRHVITLGIIFAVIILILVEVGPILWLRFFSTVEEADDLANAAASQYKIYQSEADATAEVVSKMKIMGFSDEEISQSTLQFLPAGPVDKTSVRMTVVRYANTLIIRHIPALKKLSKVSTTKEVQISAATQNQ
jgi:hypothetical protein